MTTVPGVEMADLARLQEGEVDAPAALRRIVDHARTLVAGCTGAGLTVHTAAGEELAATTDDRVARAHAVQFDDGHPGPAREAMRFGEPRRSDGLGEETRWPEFVRTARGAGFRSCLALPLPFDRHGASALNLYADEPGTFDGTTFDIALLFAAQGGVALDNEGTSGVRDVVSFVDEVLRVDPPSPAARYTRLGWHCRAPRHRPSSTRGSSTRDGRVELSSTPTVYSSGCRAEADAGPAPAATPVWLRASGPPRDTPAAAGPAAR